MEQKNTKMKYTISKTLFVKNSMPYEHSKIASKDVNRGKQMLEQKLNLIKSLEFPDDFVSMNDGKYTQGEEISTSVGGCTLSLLYFEKDSIRQGILTHYGPTSLSKNLNRLKELKENLTFNPDYQKGVLLTPEEGTCFNMFKAAVECIFPGINLETIIYDESGLNVTFNPNEKIWKSNQFGERSFSEGQEK